MCPICKIENTLSIYELYDDRYGYYGLFNLLKCKECSHVFVKHNFKDIDLVDLYSNYYPRASLKIEDFKPLVFNKSFKSWFDGNQSAAFTYVPKNIRILDIGCGFGYSLGYHKQRGCDVFGVEADINAQRIANHYGFNIHNGLFNSNVYEKEFFDYVTMDQVLEHTVEPIEILNDISIVLKKGGSLVVSIPNATGWGAKLFNRKWINWHIPYHLQHFSKKSFLECVSRTNNLKVKEIKTITSSEWLYYQVLHLLTYPKIGQKSIFWSNDSTKRNISIKIVLKLVYILYKMKLFHIVTRIFDGLGMGDNMIIIMEKK